MEVSDNHNRALHYLKNINNLTHEILADALTYKWFRLCTLYHIKNKEGKKVLFAPNKEQENFYLETHGRDIILKCRQIGFTTFKMISDLDDCLFIENHSTGCICHNLLSAKDIYRNKIKYAYQNITNDQKELLKEVGYTLPSPINDKDNSYVFDNGSSIMVSTSYRGGTLQSLHVSEFGKICKQFPEKAKEVVTGAFEAVGINGEITIESTAEGKEGYFYSYSSNAKKLKDAGKTLSKLDFNFHFYSWFGRPEYSLVGDISEALKPYFTDLKHKHDIELSDNQKAWYSAKWQVLGDDMRQEYPSTPDEAFSQSIEGAYYSKQFTQLYKEGRIVYDFTEYLGNKGDVNVVCDIGIGDSTALWFWRKVGNEIHILHYHENSGEPLGYYIKYIQDKIAVKGWSMGKAYGPHDMNNREFASNGKTRKELAAEGVGYNENKYRMDFYIVPKLSIDDGIQAVRDTLPRCVFDHKECESGISAAEAYRKEWNDKLGCYRDKPLHDWASHGADALRYLAITETKRQAKPKKDVSKINVNTANYW